jgi:hypothetical protein
MSDSITCPKCGMTSYNPMDIVHRYCGNCHQFHASFHPEIGRELKVSELVPGTVVVITKEGRCGAVSAWVKDVGQVGVVLYAGELRLHALFYREKDELHDDNGRLHVFQYLGGDAPTSGGIDAK